MVILIGAIGIGIIFDIIAVAITVAKEEEFHAKATKKVDGAKTSLKLIKNSAAYKYIKNNTDFEYEIVGNYSLWQRIIDFFRALFGLD